MGFPERESILRVLEMPGTPQKPKWAANHQISPGTGKNCQKKMKPTHFHSIPVWLTGCFSKEMKGIWEKFVGIRKVGKTSRSEPGWVSFCGFSWGEKLFIIILGVLEVPSTPQKPKWAVNHQSNPETWKNCRKPMRKHFPLIPTMRYNHKTNPEIYKKK